jgi:Flp pilus assembly protein CpaB
MKASLFAYFIKFRRSLAAVFAGFAVLLIIGAVTGGKSGQTAVIVAAHDIGPGMHLKVTDLMESAVTTETPWKGLFSSSDQAVGHTTSHAITAGQPLGTSDVVSTDLLRGLEPDKVAVEIDPTQISNTGMLRAGNHIDLYASSAEGNKGAVLIAHDVVVLAQGSAKGDGLTSDGGNGGGLNATLEAAGLLVAATSIQAQRIATHMTNSQIVAVLLPM